MALSEVTTTFNVHDLFGGDFDARRTKAWATTNVDSIHDTDTGETRIGGAKGVVAADGTGTFTHWAPGADANPLSWQTTYHFDVPDNTAPRQRRIQSYGPFTVTSSGDMTALVEQMPVQPEYAAAILEEISGYTDHGNVSGAVTFDAPTGTHAFDATAPTTITLDGYTNGQSVALVCFTGASDVTVTDAGDLELADGLATGMLRARDTWITGGGGGEPAVPDTTPPTAVTDLSATGGAGELTYDWADSTDAESTVKYGVKVWEDSDAEPGSYTIRTSGGPVTVTDLAAGTYNVKVYAFSNGGATTADTATATVTAPPAIIADDFTGTDASNLVGRVPTSGTASAYVAGGDMANMGGAASLKITSNRAVSAGGGVNAAKLPISSGATVTIAVDYNFNGVTSGDVKVALGDAGNHYYAQVGGSGNGFLLKGDVSYNSGAIAGQPASGRLLLEVTTTTVTAKVNGTTIASTTRLGGAWSAPHAAIAIESSNTAITLDNLEVSVA